jgi:hypothetical protein
MVHSRVGEHDAFGASVIVLTAKDAPERDARNGRDRRGPVAAVDRDVDDLVVASFGSRSDRLIQHGYVGPRAR